MRNRTAAALQAVKRRKRSVVNTVSVGTIGALALGTLGTGVATAQNMIDSGDIQNQSIRSWDIHRDAVGQSELRGAHDDRGPAVKSHQVANESLLHYDIKNKTLQPQDFSQAAKDELKGEKGEKGPPGVSGLVVEYDTHTIPAESGRSWYATACPEGTWAISGGWRNRQGTEGAEVEVTADKPNWGPPGRNSDDPNRAAGWNVGALNPGGADGQVTTWAVCAQLN